MNLYFWRLKKMGTRSITQIPDIVWMYRQYDGYPEGHGRELANFIRSKELVNGIGKDKNVFNGIECFAAAMVAHFKEEPGGIYLIKRDYEAENNVDFVYVVFEEDKQLKIRVFESRKKIFEGTPDELLEAFKGE